MVQKCPVDCFLWGLKWNSVSRFSLELSKSGLMAPLLHFKHIYWNIENTFALYVSSNTKWLRMNTWSNVSRARWLAFVEVSIKQLSLYFPNAQKQNIPKYFQTRQNQKFFICFVERFLF